MPTIRIAIRASDMASRKILSGTPGEQQLIFAAPTLIWDGNTSDASPNFTALYDIRAYDGNWVRLEFATDSDFENDLVGYNDQLSAAEILAGSVPITVDDLADGSYWARLRHTVDETPSDGTYSWSTPVAVNVLTSAASYLLRKDSSSKYLRKDGTSYLLR